MSNFTTEQLARIIASLYPEAMEELVEQSEDDALQYGKLDHDDTYEYEGEYEEEYDDNEELSGFPCVVSTTSSRISIYVNDTAYAFNVSEVPFDISSIISRLLCASVDSDFILMDYEIEQLKAAQTPRLAKLIKQVSGGDITIVDGVVTLDGDEIGTHTIETLLELAADNNVSGIKQFIRFQRSLQNNTSARIISRLHDFIKCTSINIDENGNIIAYKAINDNLYDCYTGNTYLNSEGAVIEMARNKVDDDDSRTCSTGLHVCSIKYLKDGFYWNISKRLAIVKIKPEDFVSIPVDYDDAKARVCKYTVVKVCSIEEAEEILDTTFNTSEYEDDEYEDEFVDFSSII